MPAPVVGVTDLRPERMRAWYADPAWAGKPFWMVNIPRYVDGHQGAGRKAYDDFFSQVGAMLPSVGARVVMKGGCRTFMGEQEFHDFIIVEWPSPAAFRECTGRFTKEMVQLRFAALAEQILFPVSPGFTADVRNGRPPPPRPYVAPVAAIAPQAAPNAFVSWEPHPAQASAARMAALLHDPRFGDGAGRIWNVNLLRFGSAQRRASYDRYASADGAGAALAAHGARAVYVSKRCGPSLISGPTWERMIIAEYPSRSHFIQMGSSQVYRDAAPHRLDGLEATYLLATHPPADLPTPRL